MKPPHRARFPDTHLTTVTEVPGDADGDGIVTMKGVLLLRKFIANLITSFPRTA